MNNEYIDKNELREYICGYIKICNGKPTNTDIDAMFGVITLLEQMPAADVQPIKHGRWISQGDDLWLCSNCKENIIFSNHESDRTEKQRYCSRCGARMTNEQKENFIDIKAYFYDDNGNEIFDRTYHVESIKQLIYVLNETLFNNDIVESYYIEPVEVEKNESE